MTDRRVALGIKHGNNEGYCKHGCRCDECTEAHRVWKLSYAPLSRAKAQELDTSWQKEGLCRSEGPRLFYSVKKEDIAAAKAICKQCPVQRDCMEYSLTTREQHGVWGGLDETERHQTIRRRLTNMRKGVVSVPQTKTLDNMTSV